jgi:hypothetical protein
MEAITLDPIAVVVKSNANNNNGPNRPPSARHNKSIMLMIMV